MITAATFPQPFFWKNPHNGVVGIRWIGTATSCQLTGEELLLCYGQFSNAELSLVKFTGKLLALETLSMFLIVCADIRCCEFFEQHPHLKAVACKTQCCWERSAASGHLGHGIAVKVLAS